MNPVEETLERAPGTALETEHRPTSPYTGLLFPSRDAKMPEVASSEAFVRDLNLDQIVEGIVAKREQPDYLRSILLAQVQDADVIRYRQEVFSDLEAPGLRRAALRFADALRTVRSHITQAAKMPHALQRHGWLLDAGAIYCDAVSEFGRTLDASTLLARALQGLRGYVERYRSSAPFVELERETQACKEAFGAITYAMRITPGRIDVVRSQGEPDYSAEVEETFERFSQGVAKDYRVKFRGWPGIDRIGGEVLTMVAKLFPDEFAQLESWCVRHRSFFDRTIRQSERELDFYLALLDYIEPLKAAGLSFCTPEVSQSKAIHVDDTFDLALAAKLVSAKAGPVVTNDFMLCGPERIFVVSGPNQGGKTTFARTFGQLHHLASIGAPVPGTAAALAIFDRIFTHFEREEDLVRLSGKLEDDLLRIHDILSMASTQSIVILNEIFTSTALSDARYLGTKIMERIIALDLLCVFVTFVDEMASMGASVVSMMSMVVPSNPAERTFKVVRAPADGLAHALALAEKHGVTYDQIKERLAP